MADTNVAEIVEAVREALGKAVDKIDYLPPDPSQTDPDKLVVRVRHMGWQGQDHLLGSGQPSSGRETVVVAVYADWQEWNYESVRVEVRKVIRVMANRGWQLQSVVYEEDEDDNTSFVAASSFTRLDSTPY